MSQASVNQTAAIGSSSCMRQSVSPSSTAISLLRTAAAAATLSLRRSRSSDLSGS